MLCPTRELAIQVAEEIRRLAKYMHGIKVLPVYGGQEIVKQIRSLKDGTQVIIGTPGRVMAVSYTHLDVYKRQVEELEQTIKILLLPKDPNDDKNIVLEIRAGAGGDEAALFAAELYRMYVNYAESQRWKIELVSVNENGIGGFKEVQAMISGKGAYSKFKYESGVHRVQRVPETESGGRIHTSTATVAVMPEAEDFDIVIDDKDCLLYTSRCV